jgi:polysaccharide deacetylase 2 family uncharacterized protein YibQ
VLTAPAAPARRHPGAHGAERMHLRGAGPAALALLAGAALWIGWQAVGRDGQRSWSGREVVIDIAEGRSASEVQIALAPPAPSKPAAQVVPVAPVATTAAVLPPPAPISAVASPAPAVESMLSLPQVPPPPEIAAAESLRAPAGRAGAPSATATSASLAPGAASPGAPSPAAGTGQQIASLAEPRLYPLSLPAWQRNARPFDLNDPRPRIAIVIVGLGPLHGATMAAIDQLPAEVTLSFDPYDRSLPAWIGRAHALGHEVMLDLPADGAAVDSAGMTPTGQAADGLDRIDWVEGRASGYIGLVLGPGGAPPDLLGGMGGRGLLLLDAAPGARSLAGAGARGSPAAVADLAVDARADRVSIDAQLAALEARARQSGFAIGVAKAYPVTIERLLAWSRGLPEKNLALAPVSALAEQEAGR